MYDQIALPIPTISRYRSFANSFRFVRNPIPVLNEYLAECGDTFGLFLGGARKGIVSVNPDFIQHVLQKNHRNYRKSPIQTERLGHFLGKGLLTSDGDYWLQQRRLIQPGFHRARLAELVGIMLEVIDEFSVAFNRKIAAGPVDIYHQMMELAFRVVAKSLFSTSLKEEDLLLLSRNLSVIQHFIVRQVRQPYLNPWFALTGQVRRHERMAGVSERIVLDLVRERRDKGVRHDDLLQMLLDARYEDTGEGMTDRQLLEESMILFIAGHETTANALAWTWYLLSMHPDCVGRLRQELAEQLEGRRPAVADLPRLDYLMQVIQESMRLYPPAWITDRVANAEDHMAGYHIAADTMVIPYIYGVHHSPDLWPEPERFRPERFSAENRKNRHPFAYLPFGGGPRLCIGNNFALMEMQLIIAQMLRRYDFELVDGQRIDMQPLVTLRPRHGIRMRFSINPDSQKESG